MLDALFHATQPTLDTIAAHPVSAALLYLFLGAVWEGLTWSEHESPGMVYFSILLWPLQLVMWIIFLIRFVLTGGR